MNITTDIIIVGGGLVGAAAALSLARQGLSITLVESHTPQPLSESLQNDDWDSRIYAVTPGNTAFLKSLNVWDDTPPTRIAPIYEMHVQGDDGHSQLTFNAYDAGVPEQHYRKPRLAASAMAGHSGGPLHSSLLPRHLPNA